MKMDRAHIMRGMAYFQFDAEGIDRTKMANAFFDELEKIALDHEKDAGGFDTFLNAGGSALKGGISSAARAAPSIQKTMARGPGLVPAVVGAAGAAAKKLPLPVGSLNPGGGFH